MQTSNLTRRYRGLTRRLTTAAFAAALLALVALPLAASATTMVKFDSVGITRASARVIVGTVTGVESQMFPGGVRTVVHMAVTDKIKGVSSDFTVFYVPGGTLPDGSTVLVDGMSAFAPGEAACVFVDPHGWVTGGFQGKVALSRGRVADTGQSATTYKNAIRALAADKSAAALAPGVADPLDVVEPPASPAPAAAAQDSNPTPSITSMSPSVVSAGTGTTITITGTGFGSTKGTVRFTYHGSAVPSGSTMPTIPASVKSWSDTKIVCDVPVGIMADGYPASAGSGPITVTGENGTALSASSIQITFGYGGYKWHFDVGEDRDVGYHVNEGGFSGFKSAMDAATASWNDAGANFRFEDEGSIGTPPSNGNLVNEVGWSAGSLPAGVLAQTQPRVYSPGDEMAACDIVFNSNFIWNTGAWNSYDLQSVALHEFGHWLNLRDLYGVGDSPAGAKHVMYGISSSGPNGIRRTLSDGDVDGIVWLYGADPLAADKTAPVTASDAKASYTSSATIHLTATDAGGSGVAATYAKIDGGSQVTTVTVRFSTIATHTLEFWSVDKATPANVESPHHFVTFRVEDPLVTDKTPPSTTSDAQASYLGTATIHLSATDAGGSGVATTWVGIDGLGGVAATAVTVSQPGTHTITYWSVDRAGNVEEAHYVDFVVTVAPAQVTLTLTTPVTPTSARHYVSFAVYGYLTPRITPGGKITLKFYYSKTKTGKYGYHNSVSASVYDNTGRSKYYVKTKLSHVGWWKVRAYRATSSTSGIYSAYRLFQVKT